MDLNNLAAAGFFFTTIGDVVRCAFCGVEVGHWIEGDYAFKEHKRWSPSCGFVNRVFVGNVSAPPNTSQQQPSSSYDVCGPYMEYIPKTTRPACGKYTYLHLLFSPVYIYNSRLIFIVFTATKFRQHNELQWDGPMHPYYSSHRARMLSFFITWPTSSKQRT
jgi:hypothetical protein